MPDDEGLAELVRRIQIGGQAAVRDLHSRFLAGIEFLLRRRLQKSAVTNEVASVLAAAVREIQKSPPGQSLDLPQVVARIIRQQFPSTEPGIEEGNADSPNARLADSILAERTPQERNILMRRYVLRESSDVIRNRLRVSSRTIECAIASARAEFKTRVKRMGSA